MYLLLYFPFINHVLEFIFFPRMVIEIVLSNEIQFFFPNQFIFLKGKYLIVHIFENNLKLKFNLVIWTKF
jgi:hypothetical protein